MNFLFDVSPEEPVKSKKRRRAESPQETPEKVEEAFAAPARDLQIMGQVGDLFTCADESCSASYHDIIDERGGKWLIECCFCGTGQWVLAVDGILKEPDSFVFRDGVFAGLSIDDAVSRENGMDYVEWAAKKHKREAVRTACARWLDSRRGAL
jgi:hypothetical protein